LLGDVLGSILINAKSHFSFEIAEINKGHTFVVVANNYVTLVGVNDKQSLVATRIVLTGQISLTCLSGMMVATPPMLSHICLMAPSSPLEFILHNPALLCLDSPCAYVIR
jgi:hypothetical protein